MKGNCFKGCFCSKEVKVKSCFPRPWKERMGGARERGKAYGGFTLVELLVVVLIIGILSAVAVVQYKRAVYKTEVAKTIQVARSVAQAAELYYLANGRYSKDLLKESDITFSGDCRDATNGGLICGNYYIDTQFLRKDFIEKANIAVYFFPNKNDICNYVGGCYGKARWTITYYMKHATGPKAGKRECGCTLRPGRGDCPDYIERLLQ